MKVESQLITRSGKDVTLIYHTERIASGTQFRAISTKRGHCRYQGPGFLVSIRLEQIGSKRNEKQWQASSESISFIRQNDEILGYEKRIPDKTKKCK